MRIQDYISSISFSPRVGLILGSGLGSFTSQMDIVGSIPYSDVDGMPTSTVVGHAGQFTFGYIGGEAVMCMQGRVHYYEGYAMQDVVSPIVIMHRCGVRDLIITNAAGGINADYSAGELMLISDHIMMVPNPLIGKNDDSLGKRFPDMSDIYNRELRNAIKAMAIAEGIRLREGVYIQVSGPSYETPSEIKMYRTLGADAVGMSTACEAVMASYMSMRVVGVSCVTNMAAGLQSELDHTEVMDTSKRVQNVFGQLLGKIIRLVAGTK